MSATSDPSISFARHARTSSRLLSPSYMASSRSGAASPQEGTTGISTRVQLDYRRSPLSVDRAIASYATILTAQVPGLHSPTAATSQLLVKRRDRSSSFLSGSSLEDSHSPATTRSITTAATTLHLNSPSPFSPPSTKTTAAAAAAKRRSSSIRMMSDDVSPLHLPHAKSLNAQRINDSMVYLEGPQIYTCGECRTHLSTHDDIISKSFHGRHGRAYLLDQCVNVTIGPAEDRRLMTGLHSVCDIFCKRCNTLVGWTYKRAYESSQKYKEGKFIVEKIHLMLDGRENSTNSDHHRDRSFRKRSLSWGSRSSSCTAITDASSLSLTDSSNKMVYEY